MAAELDEALARVECRAPGMSILARRSGKPQVWTTFDTDAHTRACT
jgi:hypothetical protein